MRALLFATLLTATPLLAQNTSQSGDISGTYSVLGRNPDGAAYSGSIELTATGNRYTGAWSIAGQDFRGSGTLDGRILTLHWAEGGDPVVYVLMPDGELHGTWADGLALERLEPQR